jgi:hypothetical protein
MPARSRGMSAHDGGCLARIVRGRRGKSCKVQRDTRRELER